MPLAPLMSDLALSTIATRSASGVVASSAIVTGTAARLPSAAVNFAVPLYTSAASAWPARADSPRARTTDGQREIPFTMAAPLCGVLDRPRIGQSGMRQPRDAAVP